MRQTPDTEATAVRETPPVPEAFWSKARALAEWMEEQDAQTD